MQIAHGGRVGVVENIRGSGGGPGGVFSPVIAASGTAPGGGGGGISAHGWYLDAAPADGVYGSPVACRHGLGQHSTPAPLLVWTRCWCSGQMGNLHQLHL